MNRTIVIEDDAAEVAFEKRMMDEAGVDEAGWFMKTDPSKPPFKAGDRVWIESMAGGFDGDMVPKLRTPQTVEKVTPMPCSDGPLWNVDLVGIPYVFSQYDLKKA